VVLADITPHKTKSHMRNAYGLILLIPRRGADQCLNRHIIRGGATISGRTKYVVLVATPLIALNVLSWSALLRGLTGSVFLLSS
jgi:hypothetical protein